MARVDNLARLTAEIPSSRLAIALVGPGRVGSRLLTRLVDRPDGWQLCTLANSRLSPSAALTQAHAHGVTEPDPRHDLDGVDVARKLVILAREAGLALNLDDVHIESLVPPMLAGADLNTFLKAGAAIDEYWQHRVDQAPGRGKALCFIGRVDSRGRARVGLEKVSQDHSFAQLTGADNRIEIRSDCYRESPLVVQGPGAGMEVTALALWSGLQRISEYAESDC